MKHRSTWDPTHVIKEGARIVTLDVPYLSRKAPTFIRDGHLPNDTT